jgi:hypothetical protein
MSIPPETRENAQIRPPVGICCSLAVPWLSWSGGGSWRYVVAKSLVVCHNKLLIKFFISCSSVLIVCGAITPQPAIHILKEWERNSRCSHENHTPIYQDRAATRTCDITSRTHQSDSLYEFTMIPTYNAVFLLSLFAGQHVLRSVHAHDDETITNRMEEFVANQEPISSNFAHPMKHSRRWGTITPKLESGLTRDGKVRVRRVS